MKRDLKRMIKRGKNPDKLIITLDLLATENPMPEEYHDHQLKGDMKEYRECHIEPDWLLIYRIIKNELILLAFGTGTHSDLFKK
jgi:mRNA interferase YafQ